MQNLNKLNGLRDYSADTFLFFGSFGDETCGAFWVPSPVDHRPMRVLATAGEGWDHVSVSRKNRPPNWTEMEHVKRLFFLDNETAMQLHVPDADHVNHHPHCMHLWRPHHVAIPRPPSWMVGPKAGGEP